MPSVVNDLKHRLRYVIHLGLVEIRNLAYCGGQDAHIAKLADVLEFLPRYLEDDREPDMLVIREQFEQYRAENPLSRYDYLGYLDGTREILDY
jgi:hypothetical protein